MKEYELIWEIFNKCPRNQMRDVFVEELELEDPEEYIRNKFKGRQKNRTKIKTKEKKYPMKKLSWRMEPLFLILRLHK